MILHSKNIALIIYFNAIKSYYIKNWMCN